jgi:hypothetical protein
LAFALFFVIINTSNPNLNLIPKPKKARLKGNPSIPSLISRLTPLSSPYFKGRIEGLKLGEQYVKTLLSHHLILKSKNNCG